MHIKDRRVDKGTGLYRIATKMKIDLTSFAAIGDSKSYLPMFRLVGYSSSVGNASPELKEISDYVAGAKYGDGFAEIIEHMIEEGLI